MQHNASKFEVLASHNLESEEPEEIRLQLHSWWNYLHLAVSSSENENSYSVLLFLLLNNCYCSSPLTKFFSCLSQWF